MFRLAETSALKTRLLLMDLRARTARDATWSDIFMSKDMDKCALGFHFGLKAINSGHHQPTIRSLVTMNSITLHIST
jgi:hypothetical protein